MNRIYQGKVTQVEIPHSDFLSASIPFSASDGEKVAKPDEVSQLRCRSHQWRLFHRDTDEARKLTGQISKLRQQVNAEITARAGWSVEEQKRRPKVRHCWRTHRLHS